MRKLLGVLVALALAVAPGASLAQGAGLPPAPAIPASVVAAPIIDFDSLLPPAEIAAIRSCTSTFDVRPTLAAAEGISEAQTGGPYGTPARIIQQGPGCYYFAGHYSIQHAVTFRGQAGGGLPAGASLMIGVSASYTGTIDYSCEGSG